MASPRIAWRTVALGAGVALTVLALTIAGVALADIEAGSNWVFLFYAVGLGGLAAGAWRAASRRPDAALAHGLLAALAAYALLAVVAVALRLVLDRGVDAVALTFNALMAGSAGILGTMIAERWPRSP